MQEGQDQRDAPPADAAPPAGEDPEHGQEDGAPPPAVTADEYALTVGAPALSYNLFSYDVFDFGEKPARRDKDCSVPARLQRMRERYETHGMRRSVEGVILVHNHGHPCILLLQIGNFFKLPGGRLRPGEGEIEGLTRKLNNKLTDPNSPIDWQVAEPVSTWWRPNFETYWYPYVPPHITKPKECLNLKLVLLPDKCVFAVPSNLRLMAVPLFELHDNAARYGAIISTLPTALSRFNFTCAN